MEGRQSPEISPETEEENRPYETDRVGSPKRRISKLPELDTTIEAVPDPEDIIGWLNNEAG